MPLDVGDAVLTFLGDTTPLDQAFARVETNAEKSMSAAADSVDQVGDSLKGVSFELDATASNAAYAGGEIKDSMGGAGLSVAQLEEKIRLAKERMAELAYEASIAGQATAILRQGFGELGDVIVAALGVEAFKAQIEGAQKSILALELLSEKTGIAITTMSGIEHVSEAAGVAFDQVSTALTRLSRAQILALEGSQQQITAFQRIGISTSELKTLAPQELFYRVGEALGNASSHGAAAASAFSLLGRGGAALIPIFQQSHDELRGMVDEAAKASGVTKDAANSAREWESQTANLSEAWRSVMIPLMKGAVPVIRAVETAASSVAMVIRDLASVFGGLGLVFIDSAKGMGAIFDDVIHGNFAKLASDGKQIAETMTHDLLGIGVQFKQEWANTADYINHVWTDVKPLKAIKDDFSDITAKQKDLTKVAKSALDEQLANIEAWKAAQHAAYATGAIDAAAWAVAELHATDAAVIAHEDYLRKIIAIYTKAGEAEKARAATQELAALQTKNEAEAVEKAAEAMQKHTQYVRKLREEYEHLIAANVDKEFQKTQHAVESLTHAEDELTKAQTKLAENKLSQYYKDQETAITKLAAMHLITEQQKNDRLDLLEHQQATEAIEILTDQLNKEKAVMEAAQVKIAQAQGGNPLFSATQLADLRKNLAQAESAVDAANAEMARLHKVATGNPLFTDAELADFKKKLAEAEAAYQQAQAKLEAAQAQMKSAHGNPFVTDAQIAELQINLDKAKIAVTNTETQIVATKEKFNKQSEADDKGHYGRALLLAMAAGNELLAEQLKQNHALLLGAQAELTTAKARGLNTDAIHKEINALKQNELALEKESNGGKLLTAEKQKFIQEAILAAQGELAEARARGLNTTAIEQEIKYLQKLEQLQQKAPAQMQKMHGAMDGLRMATQQLEQEMKAMEQQMSQAFASAIMGAITSGKSIGAALEAATKQVLIQLATQSLAYALFNTAKGIACSVTPGEQAMAAGYFAAAAEFALVAGVAGAVGMAIPGGGGSGGGSQGAPQAGQTQASGSGGGGSQQTVGITHLAAGGVVSRKIMIGDSPSGGDADEAILPLSDAGAMSKIVNAILPVLPQNAPGFGYATPAQRPPLNFDLSQPSSSERPDIHSGNPVDGDFERSEASMPRDMQGMEALAAGFGGLLSNPTLRAGAGARTAAASAAAAVPPTGFDSNSMEKFADRIGQQINQGGNVSREGDTHIHNHIKGLISPDNLKKVIKQQNRLVQNRRATVKASDSLRLTRRSQ